MRQTIIAIRRPANDESLLATEKDVNRKCPPCPALEGKRLPGPAHGRVGIGAAATWRCLAAVERPPALLAEFIGQRIVRLAMRASLHGGQRAKKGDCPLKRGGLSPFAYALLGFCWIQCDALDPSILDLKADAERIVTMDF